MTIEHNVWQSSPNTVAVNPALGQIDKIAMGDDERLVVRLDSGMTIVYPVDPRRLVRANLVGAAGLAKLYGLPNRQPDPPPEVA